MRFSKNHPESLRFVDNYGCFSKDPMYSFDDIFEGPNGYFVETNVKKTCCERLSPLLKDSMCTF